MTFINVRREAELSVAGVVPGKFRKEAVLIDVGSGNTKGGYFGTDNQICTFSVPFGTVSFAELVTGAGGSFPDQVRKLREEKLAPAVKKQLATAVEMTTRRRVYLSGGIVWATATLTHPEDRRAFTPLTVTDIDDLHKRLAAEPGKFPRTDLSAIADEGKEQQAREEIEKVKKVYTPEQLLAGLQVLKALADEMQLAAGEKQVYFARHGSLAWILGYVVEKGGERN
jgi:exopolyphosphatase/pppGpp-phosphohydrolase